MKAIMPARGLRFFFLVMALLDCLLIVAAGTEPAIAQTRIEKKPAVSSAQMKVMRLQRPAILWKANLKPFGFNSSALLPQHIEELRVAVSHMNTNPNWTLVIEGHRDTAERPGLSQERINRARDQLVSELGLDAARIISRNLCASCPVEGNSDLNRRIEIGAVDQGSGIPDDFSLNTVSKCAKAVLCHETPPMSPVQMRRLE